MFHLLALIVVHLLALSTLKLAVISAPAPPLTKTFSKSGSSISDSLSCSVFDVSTSDSFPLLLTSSMVAHVEFLRAAGVEKSLLSSSDESLSDRFTSKFTAAPTEAGAPVPTSA